MIGEGQYNVYDLTEIKVTDSFLGLDENVRECQNEEHIENCTTRHYMDTFEDKCGCLPLNLKISDKVSENVNVHIIL